MSGWLARLKSASTPDTCATKTTKTPKQDGKGVYVGFVACPQVNIQKSSASESSGAARNAVANDGALVSDTDRWCWPNSPMWNQREIDTFLARQARFTDKGICLDDAENFGEKLVKRDRENDDRVLCLECKHLHGYGRRWRCGNWKYADMPPEALAHDFVTQLQRCIGFDAAIPKDVWSENA